MNESNWLKLSGLLHRCIYNNENPQCPFIDYREQDYVQLSNVIDNLSAASGKKMLSACGSCRHKCKAVQAKVIPINNATHFRVIG